MKSLFSVLPLIFSVNVCAGPMSGDANCQEIMTISKGEFYLDGGSLRVDGLDRCLQEFSLRIDNSLERERRAGYPKVVLNGVEIERKSSAERQLLTILDQAVARRITPLSVKRFKGVMANNFDEETKNTAALIGAVEYLCLRQERVKPGRPCAKYLS
jgi:hypothetical protein